MVFFRTFATLLFLGVSWSAQRAEANPPPRRAAAVCLPHAYHQADRMGGMIKGYGRRLTTAMSMVAKSVPGIPAAAAIETETRNAVVSDVTEPRRHDVSANRLSPVGAVICRTAAMYHEHKKAAWCLALVFLTLLCLVMALTASIFRRKKVEQALLKSEQRYQQAQKMEAIGQLAAGVAHDFNNLLTPIVGYTEMMLEDVAPGSPFEPRLRAIHESADSARELTRELLSFARKQVLEMTVIDFQTTLKRVQDMASRIIREDIDYAFDIAPELSPVKADAAQILQVCLNLISNAVDAMPKGGTLRVSAENVTFAEEHIFRHQTVPPGDYVVLSVSDTGTGIATDIQDRVFEPFFTTKLKGKGTGLGLSMVYGTVSQHNGYIWFTSDSHRGTTFSVCLPQCARPEKIETLSPVVQPSKRKPKKSFGEGQTVLVAEDDAMVRRLACETLTRNGFKVIEAVDGQDALDKALIAEDDIDMLLSDVVMPRMDGVELYNEIIKVTPDIKVLFMSGYAGDILDDHGVNEDGFELIRKPFRFNELLARVRDVLEKEPFIRDNG
ncbi:MAG: ATP-binding protein [Lentisphaeria bacterium]|nr:ATP-binding protein [Lentisphaeria bacterium]